MKNRQKILWILFILAVIILWWWRFWHFVIQDVPLWYDPGRYRAYFLSVIEQLPDFDYRGLPDWVRRIFPPFLWLFAAILHDFTWISLDFMVWWWVGVQSALISLALYFFISAKDKKVALIVALLSWISFVQYEVFRRNYMKQLMGMFLVLMTLWLRSRNRLWLSLPLLLALSVAHRPWLLVIASIWGLRFLIQCWQVVYQKYRISRFSF